MPLAFCLRTLFYSFLQRKNRLIHNLPILYFTAVLYPLLQVFFLLLKKDFMHNLSLYLISYGIFRYFLEYLRGDNRGELIGLITPSQFWSLLMILLGIILIFVIKNLYQRNGK
ncbi:MAG: prolipoprotein diacylglyceryl transferase [Lachnospiraceae bacterium]|nr:prolipoprotein diacylglyceryl transferase [Lachnospiraceae bacterium]